MIKSQMSKNRSFSLIYCQSLKFLKNLNEKISNLIVNCSSSGMKEENNKLTDQIQELEQFVFEHKNTEMLTRKWLFSVAISSFTHVDFVFMSKLKRKLSFSEIFSKEFLSILLLINSSAFFLLATENRFICKEIIQKNLNSSRIKSVFPQNIKFKLQRMKRFGLSKSIHSKAVLILDTFFIEDFPLKRHLHHSFMKNYNTQKELEFISKVNKKKKKAQLPFLAQSTFPKYLFIPTMSKITIIRKRVLLE